MKTSRFKFSYRQSSSKLHKAVGDCIRTSKIWRNYRTYQEYPVSKVNPSYSNNKHHFDWVVLDLKLVIECHGKQHYEIATFGGRSVESAVEAFHEQKSRDKSKEWAALDAGWTYIVIPYSDINKISEEYILNLYRHNINNEPIIQKEEPEESQYSKDQKQKAKLYRQQRYRQQKEYLDKLKKEKKNGAKDY